MDISKLTPEQKKWAAQIWDKAEAAGINPNLATSIAFRESGFNPSAQSKESSAHGLGQFINSTAERYGYKKDDPESQVNGIVEHLKSLKNRYGDDEAAMIVAYKHGEGVGDAYKKGGFDALKDQTYNLNGQTMSVLDDVKKYGADVWDTKSSLEARTKPAEQAAPAPTPAATPNAPEQSPWPYTQQEVLTGALKAAPGAAVGATLGATREGINAIGDFLDKRSALAAIAKDAPPEIKAKGANAVANWANALYKDTGYVGGGHYKEAHELAREAGDFGKSVKSATAGTGIDPNSPFFQNSRFNPAQQEAAAKIARGEIPSGVAGGVAEEASGVAKAAVTPPAKGMLGGAGQIGQDIVNASGKSFSQAGKTALELGKGAGRIGLHGLGGAGAALDAVNAYDEYKKGNIGHAIVNAVGAVGGGISLLPGGQVVGIPISMLPLVVDVGERLMKRHGQYKKQGKNQEGINFSDVGSSMLGA